MTIRIEEDSLKIEKVQTSDKVVAFLRTQQQIVEVRESEKYYNIVGKPTNLYYFLINAAQMFSVELF